MKISLNWLRQYVDINETPFELGHMLTMAGLEVSSVCRLGEGIGDIVVAQILTKDKHPDADKLSLCTVTDGASTFSIVCGAQNMVAGDRVPLARVGAELPGGFKIKKAKLRGQLSEGMMCSGRELGLGEDHSGLLLLPHDAPLGERLVDFLGLPDDVIEIEITPNRPDWLSVVGVAREIAALTGRELRLPAPKIAEAQAKAADVASVAINAPDLCHRYAARFIRGVMVGPSPVWMQRRLESAGVRPISNVVDVTNYVLMELGHPLHAFDFKKLRGGKIVVDRAGEGEKFTTLDNAERTLTAENLMICDGQGPVAVAGVMGGLNSEVDESTADVLLESAYFLPASIRKTSKALGLKTEASYRFERGTDVEGLMLALNRAAELICELAGGEILGGVIDVYPTVHAARRVSLRLAKAVAVLGIDVSEAEAKAFLTGLGLKALGGGNGVLDFEIPHYRVDIEREIDLIEEIARLKGYDKIPSTLPKSALPEQSGISTKFHGVEKVKDSLAKSGLREIITYSFIDPSDDDRIGMAQDSALRGKVTVQNPLGLETSVMRTSLLPSLLRVAGQNSRRGNKDLRLFEVGRTFHPTAGNLPDEVMRAGALIAGRRNPVSWWAGNEKVDFFDAKGILEEVLLGLGVKAVDFRAANEVEWLKPGCAAMVSKNNVDLGWIGEVRAEIIDRYELAAPVLCFMFDVDLVQNAADSVGVFGGLDKYPSVERDLAFLADRKVSSGAVIADIRGMGFELVKGVTLFDAFEGGKLPEGKQSLAFRVTYRSESRTLTEEEVSKVEAAIIEMLIERHGVRLRDV